MALSWRLRSLGGVGGRERIADGIDFEARLVSARGRALRLGKRVGKHGSRGLTAFAERGLGGLDTGHYGSQGQLALGRTPRQVSRIAPGGNDAA
jgi:hypothetical protein